MLVAQVVEIQLRDGTSGSRSTSRTEIDSHKYKSKKSQKKLSREKKSQKKLSREKKSQKKSREKKSQNKLSRER
jgi:hypothetical protein